MTEVKIDTLKLKKIKDNYISLYKKYIYVILPFVIFSGFFGYMYSLYVKPIYTANLTFALEDRTSGMSNLGNIASQFGINFGNSEGGAFAGENIIELIKSKNIVKKTLLTQTGTKNDNELIANIYIRNSGKFIFTTKSNQYINIVDFEQNINTRKNDSILNTIFEEIINEKLTVTKLDKKLDIITVKMRSHNELLSKIFCEKIVENVISFYTETKVGKSRNNIKILESKIDSVKNELNLAFLNRADFIDQNNSIIKQRANVPKMRQEIKVQMLSALYTELVKNLEISKITLLREEPLIQIIDQPTFPLEKAHISKFKCFVIGILVGFVIVAVVFTIIIFLKFK